MYPDDLAVVAECARDPDNGCMAKMRAEIIEGADRSGHVDVDRDNSIDGRLADLLRYLAREYPSESWETFLATDGSPKWDRIAVGGLSQGGGHAAPRRRRSGVRGAVALYAWYSQVSAID